MQSFKLAATVEAPDTAKPIYAPQVAVGLFELQLTVTSAFVPVVIVTAGPTVPRSTKLVLVVVWDVATVAVPDADVPPPDDSNVHTFDAVRTRLPPFDVARVSGVPLIVTPAPAAIVTVPAPRLRKLSRVLSTHATVACAGIVSVTAAALDSVTVFPASSRAAVYVVELIAFCVGACIT